MTVLTTFRGSGPRRRPSGKRAVRTGRPCRSRFSTASNVVVAACLAALAGCERGGSISTQLAPPLVLEEYPKAPATCRFNNLTRQELHIDSETPGISLFMFRVPAFGTAKGAVLLLHGAGSPASALWDLEPGDYSMMRRLACAGFDTYAVDVRGYGGSTWPPPLLTPAQGQPPAVRAQDVMPDVAAALRYVRKTSAVERVDLVGWSWGCVVAGMAAGRYSEQIRRLILFAPVYDRRWPTRHKTTGAWRTEDRKLYFEYYDPAREDRTVLEAHVQALFRFVGPDETVRLPNGPYRDLYGPDAPVWKASAVRAPTLIMRGENDPASQRDPAYRLFQALENAPVRRYVELGGAGHFAFRTRQYRRLQAEVLGFLTEKM